MSNAVLVVGSIILYHGICSLVSPMLYSGAVKGMNTRPTILARRDGLEKRSSGDDIWNQACSRPGS